MKLCGAEIIKKLDKLNDDMNEVYKKEEENCRTTYTSTKSSDYIESDYDFEKTQALKSVLEAKVRKYKNLLQKYNYTFKLDTFGMTIAEALEYRNQIIRRLGRVRLLAGYNELYRQSNSYTHQLEFTKTNYKVAKAIEERERLLKLLDDVNIEIDRANVNNFLED